MSQGGIVGLMLVILLLVVLAVDAAFYKTKQCGLIWTISRILGRKDEGTAGISKSPEDGDEAAAKLLAKDKDDAVRTENEVDGGSEEGGKDGTGDQVEEQTTPESKELEPEDKEEKPPVELVSEPVVQSKGAETPAKESEGETTPAVETQPPAEEKTDKPASA
ncbi:hypothetical protein ACOMHN_021274 [Nucella lapillus]